MTRRSLLLVLVVASFVVGRAYADLDLTGASRYVGMGDCGIAVADDAAAVDFNPANLGTMKLLPNMPDRYWDAPGNELDKKLVGAQIIGTGSLAGDTNEGAGYIGGQIVDEVHKKHGFAIGWKEFDTPATESGPHAGESGRTEQVSLGYGHEYYYQHWCWGFSFVHDKTDFAEGVTSALAPPPNVYNHQLANSLQAGGLFWFPQPHTPPIRAGIVIQDLVDNNGGPFLNLGGSVPVSRTLLFAADWNDVFGRAENDVYGRAAVESVNVGAEWAFQRAWRLRAGDANCFQQSHTKNAPTAGVGWLFKKYRVDLAYVAPPAGTDRWAMTGTYTF
jgi:hypothetical protein